MYESRSFARLINLGLKTWMKRLGLTAIQILAVAGLTELNFPTAQATPLILTNPFSYDNPYGLSPFSKWKTIESENFLVTFPEELSPIANRATDYLEEAHNFLSPLFRWKPINKTQILVIDNRDTANGLTTPLARFGIILWATPPDSTSSLNFYDDWLRLLIIHEYTHYLNMDTTEGVWKALRPFFGPVFLPNAAWPPWMLEGLAVYTETQFTTSGRGRSTYYEMLLRAAVEEKVLDTPEFITLDKITGTNPYYPGEDTRYLFGYYLMNAIAQTSQPGLSHDQNSITAGGADTLGLMSERSASRIPFFINGNLENILGKDWYTLWQEWVVKTKARGEKTLGIIHSEPITQYTLLTQQAHSISNEAEGLAVSNDGHWIAYNLSSSNKRPGLFLRDLLTGETRRLGDKLGGMGMSFVPMQGSPSTSALVYSELNREGLFRIFSDLKLYDLKTDSVTSLTDQLRARDPDVSKDGKWVTFTLAESSSTLLARAPLVLDKGQYSLGPIEKLYIPPQYDRVANPKFSANDEKIFFTIHPNGKFQEDLMEIDNTPLNNPGFSSPRLLPRSLIADGYFNRFPTLNKRGDLYYISNRTGVDNLYQYVSEPGSPILVTNMTSGISIPSFNKNSDRPEVYASVFSTSGWDVARVKLSPLGLTPAKVTLPRPPEPPSGLHTRYEGEFKNYPITDYFLGQSLLPRIWTPLLDYSPQAGLSLGAETLGFDATSQHRYILGASYNFNTKTPDFLAFYSNRTLGPTIDLQVDIITKGITTVENYTSYLRQATFAATIAYPFLWTYSSLTPLLGLNFKKVDQFQSPQPLYDSQLLKSYPIVPRIDALLIYSRPEFSKLSLTSESGRITKLGAQLNLYSEAPVWKGLFVDQEFIRLSDHTVLSPSVKTLMTSSESDINLLSNTFLMGRQPQIVNSFANDSFTSLTVRGYPSYLFLGKAAFIAALDLTFPLGRIFRGWGTNPFFLNNLYGFTFFETSYLSGAATNYLLPSLGGGLRLTTEAFTLPFNFSWEYQQGLNPIFSKTQDLFFQITSSLPL